MHPLHSTIEALVGLKHTVFSYELAADEALGVRADEALAAHYNRLAEQAQQKLRRLQRQAVQRYRQLRGR